ncbi:MAG: TlpA family protein disulfide reductase [Saprospiraceae bacterium]|nr:TlpA family protein disulfide reductase [Saprospiraceae bacterium]
MKINMWSDCFVDSMDQIKAVVYRSATPEETAQRLQQVGKNSNTFRQRVARWVGEPAPPITATDINGNPVNPANLKGKIVVLNFWFAACHPCKQEMPELNRLVTEFKQEDIVFLGLTFDSEADTRKFLSTTAFDYQVLPNSKFYFDQFGLGPCPVNMVVDANGYISYTEMGYEAKEQQSYEGLRKAILHSIRQKGKP